MLYSRVKKKVYKLCNVCSLGSMYKMLNGVGMCCSVYVAFAVNSTVEAGICVQHFSTGKINHIILYHIVSNRISSQA